MVKASTFNENGFKKGAWSEEEDDKLRAYITRYGHWNWGLLPKFAGLARSGKSCRLRWMNYLRPYMKHGNFTIEEDNIIVDLHNKLGNKWSVIAANLPGRSDNEIKNRWNVHLKKRAQVDQTMLQTETLENLKDQDQERGSPSCSSCSDQLTSYWLNGSDCAVSNDISPQTYDDHKYVDDFWAEPFFPDITITSSPVNSMSSPLDMMMNEEFAWSMMDYSHFEYNTEFMN